MRICFLKFSVGNTVKQSCQWADQINPEPGPNPKMQARTRPELENNS